MPEIKHKFNIMVLSKNGLDNTVKLRVTNSSGVTVHTYRFVALQQFDSYWAMYHRNYGRLLSKLKPFHIGKAVIQ